MKKIVAILLLLAVAVCAAACKKDDGVPDGMMDVSAADVAYRLFVPNTWVANNQSGVSGAYVSNTDRSNVTVTAYIPDTDGVTPTSYWEDVCLPAYSAAFAAFHAVGEGADTTLGGRNARQYIYTFTLDGTEYECMQTVAVQGGFVYSLTYTAETAKYADHTEEVATILSAFVFK